MFFFMWVVEVKVLLDVLLLFCVNIGRFWWFSVIFDGLW